MNSRLEGQVCLDRHRVRGLRNVTIHVALCIIAMLLVAVAALRLGVPKKARLIATFGWKKGMKQRCNIATAWSALNLLAGFFDVKYQGIISYY